jgi:hypothetical protein
MLANETTRESLKSTKPRMKDGEEPTEVLLALVSSPLLALKERGLAQILTAKGENGQPIVLAVFKTAAWDQSVGIVSVPTVANTANEEKNAASLPD